MVAYYNEIDPYAAQWLRNLIKAGHLAAGDVDERNILDVKPDDLKPYTQCHFFAGIGVWSHALRKAGWPDDREVWTASCPCQPFSAAGRGNGFNDERHLWPAFYWLAENAAPAVIFGEQVASKDGLAWLDLVQADLEAADYAVQFFDLCAAGVGAPHIRQRLYFVADAEGFGHGTPRHLSKEEGLYSGVLSQLTSGGGTDQGAVGVGNASGKGLEGHDGYGNCTSRRAQPHRPITSPGGTNGFWAQADWLPCKDGKLRPVEPRTLPLAYGAAARVGRLRAYGNAIVSPVAELLIETYLECRP